MTLEEVKKQLLNSLSKYERAATWGSADLQKRRLTEAEKWASIYCALFLMRKDTP